MLSTDIKLGFIISMYDEKEQVMKNIETLKQINCVTIVVQSDPKDPDLYVDATILNSYSLLPDLAGSTIQYNEERMNKNSTIPARAITRNFSQAFSIAKEFDVDWWIAMFGDVKVSDFDGIKKIINILENSNKSLGITRAVGQRFCDKNGDLTRIQQSNTTDFIPTFFIVKSDLIKDGLFNKIMITNEYCTEQCFGDEVNQYCNKRGLNFNDLCYSICDYAYPQFVKGIKYNPDRIKFPKYVDGFVNFIRRLRLKFY